MHRGAIEPLTIHDPSTPYHRHPDLPSQKILLPPIADSNLLLLRRTNKAAASERGAPRLALLQISFLVAHLTANDSSMPPSPSLTVVDSLASQNHYPNTCSYSSPSPSPPDTVRTESCPLRHPEHPPTLLLRCFPFPILRSLFPVSSHSIVLSAILGSVPSPLSPLL
ncbi:hypothetical protein E2C01_040276 [Portunus trituberculatus]|uniref:Uncharacterized protein n=1 Tax=Portunus trituberculatus TaxID=210409 RepID=A0A5B7FM43_PORTR|nr:hypothetical protein [Portunus trituberculatus]